MKFLHITAVAVVVLFAVVVKAAVYHYEANMRTSTSVGKSTTAEWSVRARVAIAQDRVQVSHTEVSVYSGVMALHHNYMPLPMEAGQLEQPFILHYEQGRLVGLSVVPGEDAWAVNMKRALVTLLQLDSKSMLSPVHTAEENLLYGLCSVEYTRFLEENVTVVRKFVDHGMCRESPRRVLGQCAPILCSQNPQASVWSSTDATYRVHAIGGELELQSVAATSRTVFHLLASRGAHIILVNQSLEKELEEKPEPIIKIPEEVTTVGIVFELPGNDLSQGRDPAIQQLISTKVAQLLQELSSNLDHMQVGADPEQHHRNLVAEVIELLQQAEQTTLQELFLSLDIGTSYQHETARNIFLDILPKVGSHKSTLVVRDLIIEKKVRNTTAIRFLTHLPFHVHEPTEDLLADMQVLLNVAKDFTDDMKSAVVLSFSNLVCKTCKRACSPETLDSYIQYFLNCFTGSKRYQDQLLYLDALRNIEMGSVFDYLVSIVGGNATLLSPYPDKLRYRALWAAVGRAAFHPHQVRDLCWPLLRNGSEPLDLRVAALTALTIADPSPSNYHNLLSYMLSQPDPYLYYNYYSMLQSIAHSTFPCFKELGALARKVLPVARKPVVKLWGSKNYILDFSDAKSQYGSIVQLLLVANKRTGFPNVFHFLLGAHSSNYMTMRTELFIRVEGVEDIVKQKVLQLLRTTSSIPQLIGLLNKLDIKASAAEPFHVEVALSMHGCTVMSQYTNLSGWKDFVKGLSAVLTAPYGAHVNLQESQTMLLNGEYFPTSVGTLAFTHTQMVTLTSLRGDIARIVNSLQTDMDISLFHSTTHELTSFNPLLNMWQAAETHVTVRSHLVVNNRLDILPPLGFKLSVYQPTGSSMGLVWHSRTRVSVKGRSVDRTLRSLCPTCKPVINIITGSKDKKTKQILNMPFPDVSSRLQVHILKCDVCPEDSSLIPMLLMVLDRNSKNYHTVPVSRRLLTLLHFVVRVLVAPPEDIAGYSVQVVSTHNQVTKLKLSAQLDTSSYVASSGRGPLYLHTVLARNLLRNDNSLWAWEATTHVTAPHLADTYSVNIECIITTLGQPAHNVCLQIETELEKYHGELSIRKLLSNVLKSRVTVLWCPVSNTSSCMDGSGHLDIMMAASASDEQKEVAERADEWPYSACPASNEEDGQGDKLFLDPACSQVISELTTPRTLTAVIKYSAEDMLSAPDSTSDGHMQPTVIAKFPVSSNEMELMISGNYITTSMGAASLVRPWLADVLLPASDSISSKWIPTCVINSTNTRTFDEAYMKVAVPTCYVVATAEWEQDPTFAVLLRTLSGSDKLGLKIYTGPNYLEIMSRNGCTTINVNDEKVRAEDQMKIVYSFGLFVNKRGDITIIAPPVAIVYKVTSVTIMIAPLLQGHVMGLCGNYNADPSDDLNLHSTTLHCPLG